MTYNPSKDTVAGRTAAQIDAAKRKAVVSGSKKRCKKGKSCGATCINSSKVCMVDLPWVSAQGLTRVAKEIQGREREVTPRSSISLSPLENSEDFLQKLKDTWNPYENKQLNADGMEVARVLGVKNSAYPNPELYKAPVKMLNLMADNPDLEPKYKAIREKEGVSKIADGVEAISSYTGSFVRAKTIRDIDRGNIYPGMGDETKNLYIKRSGSLYNLLTSPVIPKTEVEKFRGFRATPEHLQQMIEGVKNRENFDHKTTYSWTSALKEGKKFADREIEQLPERTERVIFRTVNKRGVFIEYVTEVTGEAEILTPRNTKYRYLAHRTIKEGGESYHVFDVEEFS